MIGKDILELYNAIDRWTSATAFVEDDNSFKKKVLFNYNGLTSEEQAEENLKRINKYLEKELRLVRFEQDESRVIFYFYDDEGDTL